MEEITNCVSFLKSLKLTSVSKLLSFNIVLVILDKTIVEYILFLYILICLLMSLSIVKS